MTIAQAQAKLKKLSVTFQKDKKKFLFYPTQAMEQNIKNRVFVKGLSTNGKKRPYRWQEWVQIRKERGRQVAFVDLFYQGDSYADKHSKPPSLWRTFVTRVEGDKVVMGIDNDFNYNVKLGVEQSRRNDVIISPNTEEIAFLADLVEYTVDYVIDQALI